MSENPKPTAQTGEAQFKRVLLSQIRPSRHNTRKIIRQDMIDARSASMVEIGQTNPIIIRPLSPEELLNDGVLFEIVDGELRYRAALKNGDTEINASIQDITPLKAFEKSVSANRLNKPEWFEDYLAMEYLYNAGGIQKQEIAALFEVDNKFVGRALKILDVLNEPSRAMVLDNIQNSIISWEIAENTLYCLSDIGNSQLLEAALKVALDKHMTVPQAQKLVEWVKAGNPPETFGSAPKTPKQPKSKPALPPETINKLVEMAEQSGAEKAKGDGQTTAQEALKTLLTEIKTAPTSEPTPSYPVTSPEGFARLKQMIKGAANEVFKPESTPSAHKALGQPNLVARLVASQQVKDYWPGLKKKMGHGFAKLMESAVFILLICFLLWGLGKIYQFAVVNPLHWIESEIRSGFHGGAAQAQDAPTPVPQTPITMGLGQPSLVTRLVASQQVPKKKLEKPTPTIAYQPAISFVPAVEDPKILDLEIAALSDKVVVKDYPMTPDETIPGDVALSRMQDVADPDKYTMMIGSGKQIIQSANATNTTLTIAYKNADPLGGFLDGSKSPMNFLWEDVRYIHINEIDHFSRPGTQPEIKYQCTLVVKGSKLPLTLQCASTDDLENLVSTMEYFIRHSRLAHDAQPGGMPYPSQGVRLNRDSVVEKFWADSPADNAGLGVGYMVWSLEKNSQNPPDPRKLEALLSALAPGPHDLFYATPEDVTHAAHNTLASFLNPKRRKVTLMAL